MARLLDSSSAHDDDLNMLRSLGLMRKALGAHKPEYANLSFGPSLPMSDRRIHAWTATLDELAFEHGLFLTHRGRRARRWPASQRCRIRPCWDG
ncbi:MAG: hypothetical protein LBL95_03560 [Deltaproteobacteria bacterium]|nr:hypothetical protein [Deltaproteobacteria bacterium]